MKPIYQPKGAAREYGDYALNIYTGCPHACRYCYVPQVLHMDRQTFHSYVEPRKNIIEETKRQLEKEQISGKTIHLCFTCDPYPTGYDSSTTREIIKLLKSYGNHVQILTKGTGVRDFDLLDSEDWYGITIDGTEQVGCDRIKGFYEAKKKGIKTWISFEPVINADGVLNAIKLLGKYADKVKIGKLNYHHSDIDWKEFGKEVEQLCVDLAVNYYIKDSLRKEMNS